MSKIQINTLSEIREYQENLEEKCNALEKQRTELGKKQGNVDKSAVIALDDKISALNLAILQCELLSADALNNTFQTATQDGLKINPNQFAEELQQIRDALGINVNVLAIGPATPIVTPQIPFEEVSIVEEPATIPAAPAAPVTTVTPQVIPPTSNLVAETKDELLDPARPRTDADIATIMHKLLVETKDIRTVDDILPSILAVMKGQDRYKTLTLEKLLIDHLLKLDVTKDVKSMLTAFFGRNVLKFTVKTNPIIPYLKLRSIFKGESEESLKNLLNHFLLHHWTINCPKDEEDIVDYLLIKHTNLYNDTANRLSSDKETLECIVNAYGQGINPGGKLVELVTFLEDKQKKTSNEPTRTVVAYEDKTKGINPVTNNAVKPVTAAVTNPPVNAAAAKDIKTIDEMNKQITKFVNKYNKNGNKNQLNKHKNKW